LPPEQSNKIFITAIPSVNSQKVMKGCRLKNFDNVQVQVE